MCDITRDADARSGSVRSREEVTCCNFSDEFHASCEIEVDSTKLDVHYRSVSNPCVNLLTKLFKIRVSATRCLHKIDSELIRSLLTTGLPS